MEPLYSTKLAKKTGSATTQQFLDVLEIKEDIVVLKSGAIRAIIAVSAINYDLKSTQEQEAIINGYQNFLNSLDFPLQILISSRKINMEKYLEFLKGKGKVQQNEMLRFQISEYQNFIAQLITVSNIMDKDFYITVPFSPIENKEKGFFRNVFSLVNPRKDILEKRTNFETYRNQLLQRVDHIVAGLSGMGLRLTMLKTQEIIELLYTSYNPQIFEHSDLGMVEQMDIR